MLSKSVDSFFSSIKNEINQYSIYFDTFYTPNIDDLKQYVSSYNLRQQYNLEELLKSSLTTDAINSLRSGREKGSYNAMQFKYSPLKPSSKINNNFPINVVMNNKRVVDIDSKSNIAVGDIFFREDSKEDELIKQNKFIKENPGNRMKYTIHDTISGSYVRKEIRSNYRDDKDNLEIRRGMFCEFDLECRFLTNDTSIFEDFMFLYNSLFYKKNPKFNINIESLKDHIYARTYFSEINMAEQVSYNNSGNLLAIGFSVTIDTFMLSSFTVKEKNISKVEVHTEVRQSL